MVSPVPIRPAFGAWSAAWVLGSVVAAPILVLALGAELDGDLSIPQLTVVAAGSWAAFLAALLVVSKKYGTGRFRDDFALRFAPLDLVGVPIGVFGQLALIPLVYVPLRALWPDTFTTARLEERAQDLADRASGFSTVLLVLVVVVGAPIVEELVYRGLLQRSMAAAWGAAPALAMTALWFSLIHLSPIEYPGLFVAGLMFGAGVLVTKRIGLSIVTHAAFNATGIIVVLSHR